MDDILLKKVMNMPDLDAFRVTGLKSLEETTNDMLKPVAAQAKKEAEEFAKKNPKATDAEKEEKYRTSFYQAYKELKAEAENLNSRKGEKGIFNKKKLTKDEKKFMADNKDIMALRGLDLSDEEIDKRVNGFLKGPEIRKALSMSKAQTAAADKARSEADKQQKASNDAMANSIDSGLKGDFEGSKKSRNDADVAQANANSNAQRANDADASAEAYKEKADQLKSEVKNKRDAADAVIKADKDAENKKAEDKRASKLVNLKNEKEEPKAEVQDEEVEDQSTPEATETEEAEGQDATETETPEEPQDTAEAETAEAEDLPSGELEVKPDGEDSEDVQAGAVEVSNEESASGASAPSTSAPNIEEIRTQISNMVKSDGSSAFTQNFFIHMDEAAKLLDKILAGAK